MLLDSIPDNPPSKQVQGAMALHLKTILQDMGITVDADPNFEETPERVIKSLIEMCSGMWGTEKQIKKLMSKKFPSDYDEMVVFKNIETTSLCPHHLLPITYQMVIGYLPSKDGYVIGLSKIPRLAELLSARPVLQEQLAVDISKAINEHLKPNGAGVIIVGQHGCMNCRGVKMRHSKVVTAKLSGLFLEHSDIRKEFLAYYQNGQTS